MRWIHRLAYSLGHILNDLCAGVWFTYTLVFLQEGILLPATYAGLIMLIGQVADAIATPIIGILCDRSQQGAGDAGDSRFIDIQITNWRHSWFFWQEGRLKWHLGGCFLVLISFSFIFSPVYGGDYSDSWAKLIYYTPFVIIFQVGWASMQIAHLALINDLTHDQNERVLLASMRHFFTVLSNLAVYCITFILLDRTSSFKLRTFNLSSNPSHRSFLFPRNLQCNEKNFSSDSILLHDSSTPSNASFIDDGINFGPNDVYVFRTLSVLVLLIGTFFNILFYIGIRGSVFSSVVVENSSPNLQSPDFQNPIVRDDEVCVLIQPPVSLEPQIFKPLEWFKSPKFLILCLIYMLIRLIVNISQVYITLYLLSSLALPKSSIALVPLTIYLASALTTFIQKPLHRHIGRESACFIGMLFVLLFCGLAQFPGSPPQLLRVYIASSILGVGCTILLISSLAMVGDLIDRSHSTGAFVYGFMSFTDKLANGIVVQIIQVMQPCLTVGCGGKIFYKSVEVFGIAGFVVAASILVGAHRILNFYILRYHRHHNSESLHVGYGTISD